MALYYVDIKKPVEVFFMDLAEKLISLPPRETAGGRTSNRYSYQQVWAFEMMLEKMRQSDNFVLIMELHDDVLILDSSVNPSYIDFYQIKTDSKKSKYITSAKIIGATKNSQSIAQKLIINFNKFKSLARSIHFVSNKFFDFGELDNGIPSTRRDSIRFYELKSIDQTKIKNDMCSVCSCSSCSYNGGCQNICLNLIYFDVSMLDIYTYESTALGHFIEYLNNSSVVGSIQNAQSIFFTILSEIKRISNCEIIPANGNELYRKKCITRDDFINFINKLKSSFSYDWFWNDIKPYLLNDGFTSLEVYEISKQWKRLILDQMNTDNLLLDEIRYDIKTAIQAIPSDNSKAYASSILNVIKNKSYYSAYPKEYFIAVMIKELFS